MKNYLWLVALLPLLSGCESQAILVKIDDAYFAPPKTEAPPPADGRAGGVFETGYNWSLTADRRSATSCSQFQIHRQHARLPEAVLRFSVAQSMRHLF